MLGASPRSVFFCFFSKSSALKASTILCLTPQRVIVEYTTYNYRQNWISSIVGSFFGSAVERLDKVILYDGKSCNYLQKKLLKEVAYSTGYVHWTGKILKSDDRRRKI